MSFSFSDFSSTLKAGGAIAPEDVMAIRRAVWPDGVLARAEAETIFELHRQTRSPSLEWSDFFIEAIDRKSTRLNSSHGYISYAVFCLKKKRESSHRRL